ncbi:MAG: BLUF domain-containing protein [Allomuricauda sp.]
MYKYVSYISEQSSILTEVDIQELLSKSRANNQNSQITGILIHFNGIFTQFVEGPESSVDQLYAKIKKDPRHQNVKELISGYEDERFYKDWSMAYRSLHANEISSILGYRKLDKNLLFTNDDRTNHFGITVLKNFVQGLHMV